MIKLKSQHQSEFKIKRITTMSIKQIRPLTNFSQQKKYIFTLHRDIMEHNNQLFSAYQIKLVMANIILFTKSVNIDISTCITFPAPATI